MKQPRPRRASAQLAARLAFTLVTALLAAACGAGAAPARSTEAGGAAPGASATGEQWTALVATAKREGEVVIYGPPGANFREALVRPFEAAYPGIKVSFTGASGSDLGPRILAERQAGQFIPDVHVGGTTTINDVLKPAGVVDPIPPLLVRPDVTDTARWFENQLWWADNEQQYNLMFEGSASQIVTVNKSLVDPNSFTAYWDVLDPKYRGKIVASDIRRPGPGGGQSRFLWMTEGLGPPFLEKLFGEMDVALTEDRRQLVDWVAQGRYTIGLFAGQEVDEAIKQGLPVAHVDTRKLKEGFAVSAGWGSVAMMNQAPHPNAARVYLNWLLAPEGQLAWQHATGGNSLRTDVAKEMVDPLNVPPPGSKVFF
ncbi:MAG TPA: extracellular solute-binding protein, partial [Gemmatimonadales bacterium]|nr:extracellular solute-binding protein [Gemmatimonadales bacterium]